MPGDVPCGVPLRVLMLDLQRIDALLESSAMLSALSSNSDLIAKSDDSVGSALIGVANAINPLAWARGYWNHGSDWTFRPTYTEVRVNLPSVQTDKAFNLWHYRRQFIDKVARGPQDAIRYLDMVQTHGLRARAALREQFGAANIANDALIAQLDSSIRRADIVRVAAAAGMTVGLAFVPGSVLALTGVAMAYSFACDLVMEAQGVSNAEIVAFVKQSHPQPESLAAKHAVSGGQTLAVNQAQSVLNDSLTYAAERKAIELEKAYAEKVARYAAQGGRHATVRPLPQPVRLAQGGTMEAAALTRNQARVVNRAAGRVAAAESKLVANQRLAKYAGGAAAAGIGLFFMRDDLLRAFGSLKHEIGL